MATTTDLYGTDTTGLSENQKLRINNINYVVAGIYLLGGIAGAMYAKRTGGGILRYIGYYAVGAISVGIPAQIIATPFRNRIIKETATK